MRYIRKISIGNDYKQSMHYVLGQEVLDKSFVIDSIVEDLSTDVLIYIEKEGEVVLWKSISQTMPKIIEYKIDF